MTNKEFANEPKSLFERCCKLTGVAQTTRQASKFRMGRGRAFANKPEIARLDAQLQAELEALKTTPAATD